MSLISEQVAGTAREPEDELSAPGGTPATEVALPWIEDTDKVAPKDARALSKMFFDRLQTLEEGTHEYQYARNTLIEMNLTLVQFVARRFRNRGSGDMEEIIQVGTIGLIKAIDRFDLTREVEFATFAVPYILGEIKRFFRDTTWAVHVPRRLQELRVELAKAKEELSTRLDHDPTVKELADHLSITEEEVIDGIVAANGYTAGSLEAPSDGGDSAATPTRTLADVMGESDPAMEAVENMHTLAPLLDDLDDRERRILELRFGQEMTQSQIGAELGVSQMHISRLLTGTLNKLRTGMLA
ncbi:SigB/SigF/SigG family RNA polymerase sigma factor [Streptomyces sp. NPDC058257]|uniref:SigB/SigF/SigG family RNA polymerase sigma factor n=1 Tax=Streptomyces sp. NPDC058257 TaxID=3346409 RepID=UPI0036E60847